MDLEKISRYLGSACTHPGRALIAGFSEVTRIPILVDFNIDGDGLIRGELPDSIVRYMYLMEGKRGYEPETVLMMEKVIKEKNIVMVVGAHIGIHAIRAKQLVGDEGMVFGFEPTPETFNILQLNCRDRGIIVEPRAVTKSDIDKIKMTAFDVRHSAWNSGLEPRSKRTGCWNPKKLKVPATSIDVYCNDWFIKPDVLILDLENGEMDALLGGEKTIRANMPSIIIECGDLGREKENSTNACLSLLKSWGYVLLETDSQTGKLCRHEVMVDYPDDYPNVLAVKKSMADNVIN